MTAPAPAPRERSVGPDLVETRRRERGPNRIAEGAGMPVGKRWLEETAEVRTAFRLDRFRRE